MELTMKELKTYIEDQTNIYEETINLEETINEITKLILSETHISKNQIFIKIDKKNPRVKEMLELLKWVVVSSNSNLSSLLLQVLYFYETLQINSHVLSPHTFPLHIPDYECKVEDMVILKNMHIKNMARSKIIRNDIIFVINNSQIRFVYDSVDILSIDWCYKTVEKQKSVENEKPKIRNFFSCEDTKVEIIDWDYAKTIYQRLINGGEEDITTDFIECIIRKVLALHRSTLEESAEITVIIKGFAWNLKFDYYYDADAYDTSNEVAIVKIEESAINAYNNSGKIIANVCLSD